MSLQWYIANVLTEVAQALKPFVEALDSPEDFADFLASYGYESLATDIRQIENKFTPVKQAYETLESTVKQVKDLRSQGKTDLEDIINAVQDLSTATLGMVRAIDGLKETHDYSTLPVPLNQQSFWKDFPPEVITSLIYRYLENNQPKIFGLLTALGILSLENIDSASLPTFRRSYTRRQLNWERFEKIASHPERILEEIYSFGNTFQHNRFIGNLTALAVGFGLPTAKTDLSQEIISQYYKGSTQDGLQQLIAPLYWDAIEADGSYSYASVNLVIAPIPFKGAAENTPSGFVFFPELRGFSEKDIQITEHIKALLDGGFEADPIRLEVQPHKIQVLIPDSLGAKIDANATLTISPNKPLILFGTADSTRLDFNRVGIKITVLGAVEDLEYKVELAAESGRLRVYLVDGDGFLQKVFPKDGIHVSFDLAAGWSNKKGLYFKGGAGLEATLPVNVDLAGILRIDSVYLALEAKEDSKTKESAIRAVTATTVKVQLGPVSAIVERFGLQATLSFPEKGGNLGVANLNLGFKPPNGVGLVIKAQVVTGGGYLYFDVDKEQYPGVLQLEIAQKFSLTAVGLLTTKMPDGSKGFSLLVIISVRFDPGIQLGYGFSLNGLGGLLGVNRTAKKEVLREGLSRGALGSILFPQNVVENAPQIISNLSAIFPPAKDRFLFGPMAIIGWGGSPPLLSMEIGIILELPEPFRLIILGRLRVTLPSQKDESTQTGVAVAGDEDKKEDTPKIKLQLDSLGIFDFGSGDISLDAFLYDSTIGPFTITGGMALRISFGAKPLFLLSVGGYHPAFQAPAGFPSVDRVSVGISKKQSGVEVRLQLSAYFALTSNTVQFGSHLDLYVHVSEFEIIGLLGFDVLIQFQPFRLIASFEAMVAVRAGSIRLMAVWLQVNLEGPSPWHAWGKAQFEILLIKQSAEFSVVTGQKQKSPPLPPPIDVKEVLRTELGNPSNWSSHLPIGENPLVTFGRLENSSPGTTPPPPSKQVLIHPLAELHLTQRLVPLNAPALTRYGHATPKESTTFKLTVDADQEILTKLAPVEDISDWFARAQFYDMTDAEKLAAPSFEQMDSGIRLKAKPGYTCGTPIPANISEASQGEQNNPVQAQQAMSLPPSFLSQVAHLGAAGQAPIRASGPAKYRDPALVSKGIVLNQAQYRVVGGDEQRKAQQTRAAAPSTSPSKLSVFEEAPAAVSDMGEAVMSYSAAQARVAQARAASLQNRMWIVPDISRRRGQR